MASYEQHLQPLQQKIQCYANEVKYVWYVVNITLLPLWKAIYYHFGTKRAHLFGCFSERGGGKEESEGVGGGSKERGEEREGGRERERRGGGGGRRQSGFTRPVK